MSKIYVLYHAPCTDGFGAALCAWMVFGEGASYIPVSYGQPVPEMESGSEVYILDFSYSAREIGDLWRWMKKVVVIDHHHTAKMELESLVAKEPSAIIFDMNHSGAVLAWNYFRGFMPGLAKEEAPLFLRYIEDRDLWKWQLPHSREFSAALRARPTDFLLWHSYCFYNEEVVMLITEGEAILRFTQQQVEMLKKGVQAGVFDLNIPDVRRHAIKWQRENVKFISPYVGMYHVPAVNSPLFQSEIGEALLQNFPEAPFAAVYFDRADGKRQWSLRARKDGFDVSAVAKAFGGGGHKAAAGFEQIL